MHRHPVAALFVACALLVIVVFAPIPRTSVVGVQMLHDFAHAPIFGSVALLLLYDIRSHPRLNSLGSRWQYAMALLGAVALGGLTELAQIPVGRDSSWLDVRSDLLGAAGFLALFSVVDPRTRTRSHRVLASVIGIGLLAFHTLPVAFAALAYERRAIAFPVLADFTQGMDRFFVVPQQARAEHLPMAGQWATTPGERTLRVSFRSNQWPGLNFREPSPDWRGYAALAVDLTNPTDVPLTLTLRVHDARHDDRHDDRFNRTFQVAPRTRTVLRVPLAEIHSAPHARPMDMEHIAGLILFRPEGSAAPQMDVSRVWLE